MLSRLPLKPLPLTMMMVGLVLTGMMLDTSPALADTVTGFKSAQVQVAHQIAIVPRFVAILAYLIATFFAAAALLKLKDWINEPEKNPLNGVIFRLVVSALLLVLPHILVLGAQTLYGQTEVKTSVPMHSLSTFEKAPA